MYCPPARPDIWIEHGHQYDPVNWFFISDYPYWSAANPPICRSDTGEQRLYECLGTRFLIRYLNSLDAEYPYVDNVKPFWRFLEIFGASALRFGLGPVKAAVAVEAILRYLAKTGLTRFSDLYGVSDERNAGAAILIAKAISRAPRSRREAFKRALGC